MILFAYFEQALNLLFIFLFICHVVVGQTSFFGSSFDEHRPSATLRSYLRFSKLPPSTSMSTWKGVQGGENPYDVDENPKLGHYQVCSFDRFQIEWQLNLIDIAKQEQDWEPPLLLEMFEYSLTTAFPDTNDYFSFDDIINQESIKPVLQIDLLNDPKSILDSSSIDESNFKRDDSGKVESFYDNNCQRSENFLACNKGSIKNEVNEIKGIKEEKDFVNTADQGSKFIEALVNHPFVRPRIKRYDLDERDQTLLLYFDVETTMPSTFSTTEEILQTIKFIRVNTPENVIERIVTAEEISDNGKKNAEDDDTIEKSIEEDLERTIIELLQFDNKNNRGLTAEILTPTKTNDTKDQHHNDYTSSIDKGRRNQKDFEEKVESKDNHNNNNNNNNINTKNNDGDDKDNLSKGSVSLGRPHLPPTHDTSSDMRLEFERKIRSNDFKMTESNPPSRSSVSTSGSSSLLETTEIIRKELDFSTNFSIPTKENKNSTSMDNTMSSIEEYPLCLWKDSKTLSISFASHPKVFDFLFTNALAGQLGIRLYENPNQASKLPTKQIRRRENENGLTTTLPSLLSGKVNLRSSFTGNYYFRLSYLTLDRVTEDAKYENQIINEPNGVHGSPDSLHSAYSTPRVQKSKTTAAFKNKKEMNDIKISRRRKSVNYLQSSLPSLLKIVPCDEDEIFLLPSQEKQIKNATIETETTKIDHESNKRDNVPKRSTNIKSQKKPNISRRYLEADIVMEGIWPLNDKKGIKIPHASLPGHRYIRQDKTKTPKLPKYSELQDKKSDFFDEGKINNLQKTNNNETEMTNEITSSASNQIDQIRSANFSAEMSKEDKNKRRSVETSSFSSQTEYTLIPSSSSWSMSMWLYLREDMNRLGSFHSLFYKGDGKSETRTPSAWFLPDQSGLTIRASTENDMDLGSPIRLPSITKEWTHLVFVFENHTYERETTHATKDRSVPMDKYLLQAKFKKGKILNSDSDQGKNGQLVSSLETSEEEGIFSMSNNMDEVIDYSQLLFNERERENRNSTLSVFTNPIYRGEELSSIPDTNTENKRTEDYDEKLVVKEVAEEVEYSISVYANGRLEAKLHFNVPIIANNGALHIGKDPTYSAPLSFLSDLKLFDGALSDKDVESEYKKHKEEYTGLHHTEKLSLFPTPFCMVNKTDTNRSRDDEAANLTIISHPASISLPSSLHFVQEILTNLSNSLDHFAASTKILSKIDSNSENLEILNASNVTSSLSAGPIDAITLKYNAALIATKECQAISTRYRNYQDLAMSGHVDSLYALGKMLLWGNEEMTSDYHTNSCFNSDLTTKSIHYIEDLGEEGQGFFSLFEKTDILVIDYERALSCFLLAGSKGHAPSLRLAAYLIMNGIGIVNSDVLSELSEMTEGNSLPNYLGRRVQSPPRNYGALPQVKNDYGNAVFENIVISNPLKVFKFPCLDGREEERKAIDRVYNSNRDTNLTDFNFIIVTTATSFSLALLHLASSMGDPEAHVSLGYRYRNGLSVPQDDFTSSHYYVLAAEISEKHYFTPGRQSFHEHQRLTKDNLEEVQVGQRGEEDDSINFLKMKAEEDNIPAILALGDAYYWGSRGLPRDHPQAISYFNRASELGNAHAMCLAGGMYLKGEGGGQNTTKAIELYTSAAAMGSIKALNGLGYAYFYGNAVDKNLTKAFEFFEKAAQKESDGDSLFNAGHCLENGLGVERNFEDAAKYYKIAAERFGHFGSIHTLGKMHLEGQGVVHSYANAVKYLAPAAMAGDWGRVNRAGFDFYLKGNYRRSLLLYMFGTELGYDVAAPNAALLLDLKLVDSPYKWICKGHSNVHQWIKRYRLHYRSSTSRSSNIYNNSSPFFGLTYAKNTDAFTNPLIGDKATDTDTDADTDADTDIDTDTDTNNNFSFSEPSSSYYFSLRYHWIASEVSHAVDSFLALGDAYYFGYANLPKSYETALFFYARSSANGIPQGTFNLAYMYQMGLGMKEKDFERAMKHYIHAMVMEKPSWANWVACQVGILHLSLTRSLSQYYDFTSPDSKSSGHADTWSRGWSRPIQQLAPSRLSLSVEDLLLLFLFLLFFFVVYKIFRRRNAVMH